MGHSPKTEKLIMNNILELIGSFAGQNIPQSNIEQPAQQYLVSSINVNYGILCFSKNRPYQLRCLLSSITRYLNPAPAIIVTLYATDDIWSNQYRQVLTEFSNVESILEESFDQDLREAIDRIVKVTLKGFIVFCVDDLIFTSSISLR